MSFGLVFKIRNTINFAVKTANFLLRFMRSQKTSPSPHHAVPRSGLRSLLIFCVSVVMSYRTVVPVPSGTLKANSAFQSKKSRATPP